MNENLKNILFVLIRDILVYALIFLAGTLLAEAILPGIITSHVSFFAILLVLIGIIFGLSKLKPDYSSIVAQNDRHVTKKQLALYILLGILTLVVLTLTLLKYSTVEIIVILILSTLLYFFILSSYVRACLKSFQNCRKYKSVG